MRRYRTILIAALVCTVAVGAAGVFAGERADWGTVVCAGTTSEGGMLLIENDRGVRAVIVDPSGDVRSSANKRTTLEAIKPGDHIDFAVSVWAGMQIVDLIVVAARPAGALATVR